MMVERIRNFSIIAHIDHGKSTLADRLLEYTGAISEREFREQVLDDMELERERGITIKARAVRLLYTFQDKEYILNLIDTPGHVDFNYEVCKSLVACEGALLLVDASQGVEAQTIANLHLAQENNLALIPIINKIDLKEADIKRTKEQISKLLNLKNPEEEILLVSAKQGLGIRKVFERIVEIIPPPLEDSQGSLRAFIFDSRFDVYQGVVVYVRIFAGVLKPLMKIRLFSTNKVYEVQKVGIFNPRPSNVDFLNCGEVGFFTANIRNPQDIRVGDTISDASVDKKVIPVIELKESRPLVFSGIYPLRESDFLALRQALEKLHLNDSSFVFQPDSSPCFGQGFRCGFLGLLHMEIIQERLEREFGLEVISTSANLTYKVRKKNGEEIEVSNAAEFPSRTEIKEVKEPYVEGFIITPARYIGRIMELAQECRGVYKQLEYLDEGCALLRYDFPLAEIIGDFYDRIKSISQGYASFDYEFKGYFKGDLVKINVLINRKPIPALSLIVCREKAPQKALQIVERLKNLIPKHLFEVVIQAAIDGQIIARASIKPLRKNVTAKCYGGDITRKRKLWEKQKAGKKRMKQIGEVRIPQEAFRAVFK
ncbi:MAG: elongation factor 4 [Candidatus Omnitrophota bacterium]|nr:MAG: elongation factor 4 [Candidatus Omnitrophota bacterium]